MQGARSKESAGGARSEFSGRAREREVKAQKERGKEVRPQGQREREVREAKAEEDRTEQERRVEAQGGGRARK